MKVKLFGSEVQAYEEAANKWFAENPDIEIKHTSTHIGQGGTRIVTAVFFEEKEGEPGQRKPILG